MLVYIAFVSVSKVQHCGKFLLCQLIVLYVIENKKGTCVREKPFKKFFQVVMDSHATSRMRNIR